MVELALANEALDDDESAVKMMVDGWLGDGEPPSSGSDDEVDDFLGEPLFSGSDEDD